LLAVPKTPGTSRGGGEKVGASN
jgi:hypothetical protein